MEIRIPHRMLKYARVPKLSSGGGGVEDPAGRDPFLVRRDVLREFVSTWRAREVYKVAIDPVSLEIDWKETEALRAKQGDWKR